MGKIPGYPILTHPRQVPIIPFVGWFPAYQQYIFVVWVFRSVGRLLEIGIDPQVLRKGS
jgi:hypothetical protein